MKISGITMKFKPSKRKILRVLDKARKILNKAIKGVMKK